MSAVANANWGSGDAGRTAGRDDKILALPGLNALARGLPPDDAKQLLSLRRLQLRRALAEVVEAQSQVEQARRAVEHRQSRVAQVRQSRFDLLTDIGGRLAARLPRNAPWATAHRDWLDEQLEREEYALIDEERVLEQTQDRLAERRREQARCEHREALAVALLGVQKRQRVSDEERRQDAAREDLARGSRAW